MFWLLIIAVIIQIFACISIGVEIFIRTGLNSDSIIIEASIMGICLIVDEVNIIDICFVSGKIA